MSQSKYAIDLRLVTDGAPWEVGSSAASLAALARVGVPVTPGFVVTSPAYLHALDQAGVRTQVWQQWRWLQAIHDHDPDPHPDLLRQASAQLQKLVRTAGIPDSLRIAVGDRFEHLGGGPVLVRASPTTPGSLVADSAVTEVQELDHLLDVILDCWVRLFDERAVAQMVRVGLLAEPAIAVLVQWAVQATHRGTAAPVASRPQETAILIDAAVRSDVGVAENRQHNRYLVSGRELPQPRHSEPEGPLAESQLQAIARFTLAAQRALHWPHRLQWVADHGRTWVVLASPIVAPAGQLPRPSAGSVGVARGPGQNAHARPAGRVSAPRRRAWYLAASAHRPAQPGFDRSGPGGRKPREQRLRGAETATVAPLPGG